MSSSAVVGWALAVVALVVGWRGWGWPGVALAGTVIVFWLLLQFNRALRVLRRAAARPVGHVDSAVMLNAKLRRGLALWQVIALTKSLGQPLDGDRDRYAWRDVGGAEVQLSLRGGRLHRWALVRPHDDDAASSAATPPATP